MLDALTSAFGEQYHACVPLGWKPVVVAGTYYPGYIASLQSYAEVWDAIWRGRIAASDIANPRARPVFDVLNHLVKAGLLRRERTPFSYDYYLQYDALPYYDDISWYGNNNGDMQYLCYSRIVPERIIRLEQIRRPPKWAGRAQWYRASFTWRVSASAPWARNDPFLQAHSIILSPMQSPTTATLFRAGKRWHITNIYDTNWKLPKVSDAAAWTSHSISQ